LLISNIDKQAYIQGVDDDFLLVAVITILGSAPVFLLRRKNNNV
jgi:MFS transporter, DHA2 family, multidrug resistance protein